MREALTSSAGVSSYMQYIMSFHKSMLKHELTLIYEGEVTQDIVKAFTSLAERNLERQAEDKKVKNKVYHVMVECLQNIAKHADDESVIASNSLDEGLVKNGIFVVGQNDDIYFVTSGNAIKNENIPLLQEILDEVNSLDKDGLKALYKEKIKASKLSETGGAGLGFVDMAKKTGNRLDYHFEPIDENNSFFLLRTSVTRVQ